MLTPISTIRKPSRQYTVASVVTCGGRHVQQRQVQRRSVERFDGVVDRQGVLKLSMYAAMGLLVGREEAKAMPPGFQKDLKNRRRIRDETVDISNFQDGPQGIKYLDVTVGDGDEAREGSRVAVHFDCKWRGITFVTTRQGMGVTGGSPFGFDIGAPVGQGGTLKGLDLGVRGMRVGGQRKLIVPSELAYGDKGYGEIPPNASLVIDVQLLSIKKNAIGTQVKLIEG